MTSVKEIDGGSYSGSGTIVRQAVALAALTGADIRITNIRCKRPNPGLRPQHTRVVDAIRGLVDGRAHGNDVGSSTLIFQPGREIIREAYTWDIGSAGSTVLLAQALLPLLAFHRHQATIQLRGGIFQDFAPSFYHLEYSLLPLLRRMGLTVDARMLRPGYVPAGEGVIELRVGLLDGPLKPLMLEDRGDVERVWGVSLASYLKERHVTRRMADAARGLLEHEGFTPDIDEIDDETAAQPGAAFAVFAEAANGVCLGADRAGAPRRMAEAVGEHATRVLMEDLRTQASVDRFTADQLIIFAALADGKSRWRIPRMTDHVEAGAWLVRELLGAEVVTSDGGFRVRGVGLTPRH
jgi:RNA 3'-terminal phosphate cyclase (ATP)